MFYRTAEGYYRSTVLDALPWIVHGFGTRILENSGGEYTRVKQVHSATVAVADGEVGCLGEADALVTSVTGKFIGIRTADCVPLLLADRQRRVAGAVHAGWRGTAAKITQRAVERLTEQYGTNPADLVAAIGPCIRQCCFEVGPEVAAQFDPDLVTPHEGTANPRVDLVEANRRQLIAAGVPFSGIDASDLCTYCGAEEFHSWRRDREAAGRMAAVIAIQNGV